MKYILSEQALHDADAWPTLDGAYMLKERSRVKKLFARKKHIGFSNADEFADWWIQKIDQQAGLCVYCGTAITVIAALISAGLLKSRATRGSGKRGPSLELERIDSKGGYTPENCALACYYCNNDKSYVYSADEYREFFAPAKQRHFQSIAEKL